MTGWADSEYEAQNCSQEDDIQKRKMDEASIQADYFSDVVYRDRRG
jgi:hypothetical protein